MDNSLWFMWKKGYRTLTKNKKKVLPIIALMIVTIVFSGVMFDLQDIRSNVVDEAVELTDFADGFVYLKTSNRSDIEAKVSSIANEYFDEYEYRMKLKVSFEIDNEEYEGLLIGIDSSITSHINTLIEPDKDEIENIEYCINWDFAQDANLDDGDEIKVLYGLAEIKFEIENTGYNPEFTYTPLQDKVAFPSIEPYPVFYIPLEVLSTYFLQSNSTLINEILYDLDNKDDQDNVEDEVKNSLSVSLKNVIAQEDHPFIKTMREDEESDRQFLTAILIVFIIGSLIIIIVILHRLIESDLKNVTVFQALGARKGEIYAAYFIFILIAFLFAFFIGAFLGLLVQIPLRDWLASLMRIPFSPKIQFSFNNVAWIGLILFAASALTTYIVVRRTFTMDVQESLKYETKFLEKPSFVERIIKKVKKSLHPFKTYIIRRIFGRKLFLISLITGLTLSTGFLYIAFSLPDSIIFSINKKLEETERWDAVASTWQYENHTTLIENFNQFINIDKYEFGIRDTVLFSEEKSDFEHYLQLLAFEEGSSLHEMIIDTGSKIKKDRQALLTKDLLFEFSLDIGSVIYIKSPASNDSHKVEIVGSVNDFTQSTIYLSIDKAQDIVEAPQKLNTIYFNIDKDADEDDTAEKVQNSPIIQEVALKSKIKDSLESAIELTNMFSIILGGIFTIFGLGIVGVIIKNLVDYRIEDYANMKAIGLYDNEIRRSILIELIFYFSIAIPIGILLGLGLMIGLIELYSLQIPGLFVHIYPISFLYIGVFNFTMIIIVLLFQLRKLRDLNIIDIMRNKTFG
ncbi:MAG: FtsX-like permease family protein [Candidatus Lokiarchaeota archaeon]|nr:FtsX-like permease family protein [Candidatus Lokiarchaeota archaeon]MBD3337744.1 FtsX-like permease family protein [Candidatus Lokiarchaeota archaeon]